MNAKALKLSAYLVFLVRWNDGAGQPEVCIDLLATEPPGTIDEECAGLGDYGGCSSLA